MKQIAFLGALVGLLTLGAGCGDVCDDAADKLEECAADDPNVTVTADEDAECDAQAECAADCVENNSCEVINRSAEDTLNGADNAYLSCLAACN